MKKQKYLTRTIDGIKEVEGYPIDGLHNLAFIYKKEGIWLVVMTELGLAIGHGKTQKLALISAGQTQWNIWGYMAEKERFETLKAKQT